MAGLNATAGGGFDYIQSAEPADPEKGELWYDTDGGTDGNGEAKVYDGSVWDPTGYVSHDQLTNVSAGDHFSPGSGLTFDGGTLALLLSSYLTIDGNGDLALASGSIGTDRLAFDTATQSELDGHAGDANAHHSKPTMPKMVQSGTLLAFTNGTKASLVYENGNEKIKAVAPDDGAEEDSEALNASLSASMWVTQYNDLDNDTLYYEVWDIDP